MSEIEVEIIDSDASGSVRWLMTRAPCMRIEAEVAFRKELSEWSDQGLPPVQMDLWRQVPDSTGRYDYRFFGKQKKGRGVFPVFFIDLENEGQPPLRD